VRCEDALSQLPDYALGTLSELDQARLRSHLRGCAACRGEAASLDQGLASFGSAHVAEPPPELMARVMAVLEEEWSEATPGGAPPRHPGRLVRILSVAAAVAALVAAVAWGSVAQMNANHGRASASSYQQFLGVLGGKDVRVARVQAVGDSGVQGSAVFYDGKTERSWVLVLVKAPAFSGQKLIPSIASPTGRSIKLFPMEIDADGEGSAWLVSAGDISGYDSVRLTDASGVVIGEGSAQSDA